MEALEGCVVASDVETVGAPVRHDHLLLRLLMLRLMVSCGSPSESSFHSWMRMVSPSMVMTPFRSGITTSSSLLPQRVVDVDDMVSPDRKSVV